MRFAILIFVIVISWPLVAQEKVEREHKVSLSEVPQVARVWLEATFPRTKRLKWYFEQTSGKESYEAKFKLNKQAYSVEFSAMGVIEDIEVERRPDDLPQETIRAMCAQFPPEAHMQIRRIQEQWTGTPETLQKAVQNADPGEVTRRYEVEFTAVIEDDEALWEGTFSAEGQLLSHRKIILRPVDNLGF